MKEVRLNNGVMMPAIGFGVYQIPENETERVVGDAACSGLPFKRLKGDNKELMIIPEAIHVDLYDRMDVVPFDKFERFFKAYL